MTKRLTISINLLLVVGLNGAPTFAGEIPAGVGGFASHVRPFLDTHCVGCHGPEKSKGKVTLHRLDGDLGEGVDLERWEAILDVLELGEMPPEDERQPAGEERESMVHWIESGLRARAAAAPPATSSPTARRLTNFEYQNTMRDLLGFELNLASNLPEDPTKPYHFNNRSELMLLGPEQIDRYLDNARRAMASAIVDPEEPEIVRHAWDFDPRGPTMGDAQIDEVGLGIGNRFSAARGVSFDRWPEAGEFRIRIRAAAILPDGYDHVPLRMVMGSDLRSDAGTGNYLPVGTVNLTNSVDALEEFEFRGRIENHPVQVGKVVKTGKQPDTRHIYPQNLFDDGRLNDYYDSSKGRAGFDLPRAVVRSIEFEAPVFDRWPPAHHRRILFDSPLAQADPDAYVRAVLERFMGRAFRRPADTSEIDRFHKLYRLLEPEFGTLEATMRETLAMVLISHQFLYHTLATDGVVSPQYELASRLSYFLWGSMPDDELLSLAAQGRLADPDVIGSQARRLLADEKSHDFVENFTTQWLSIEKMRAVNINLQLFPRFLYTVVRGERSGAEVLFRPTIRDYMHGETVGFVAELIRRNASALDVVDSDFAWLNEPLANHYGVAGVKGIDFRAVPLGPTHRIGGLLTHGSVLVGNGTGSAPHPIYRAVWLREAILGDDVKPPPAEVPALSESAGESAETAVTIKDLLALHRQQESCMDCHVRLDPWGIPFERYNAVGQYQPFVPKNGTRVSGFRPTEHGDLAGYREYLQSLYTVEVSADARVPKGPEIDGMEDLKRYILADRAEEVAENLIRRFLSYGLGRELTYRDRFAVGEILAAGGERGYPLQDLIIAVCRSKTFLTPTTQRRTQ